MKSSTSKLSNQTGGRARIDNTEPTIDKIIDELLAEAIEKAITEWAGQEYPNDATFYDVTVKEAKQAIKALIANQVREARSEWLVVIDGLLELKERYGEVKDEADSEWNEALNTATAKIKELGE